MATNLGDVVRKNVQKIVLGPSKPITQRNSTVGSTVISDYLDPANGQRTLVLERSKPAAAPKAKTPRSESPKHVDVHEQPLSVGSRS